ncbi:MAG: PAS domain S-box protein, partial [Polyangiales bacterium]
AQELARLQQASSDAKQRAWVAFLVALGLIVAVGGAGLVATRRAAKEAARMRAELSHHAELLRVLADNATDLIRILEADDTLGYASPSAQEILGYSPSELQAMAPNALLHEAERAFIVHVREQLRATGQTPSPIVHRLRRKDGSLGWFETRMRTVLDAHGDRTRIHMSSRDITERKLAEESFQRQTLLLQGILESMGDGVLVLDEDRRILAINPAAYEYIQQAQGEIMLAEASSMHYRRYGSGGLADYPPEQNPLTRALQGESCDDVEVILRDASDEPRIFSLTTRPIQDAGLNTAGCVAVYRDVTSQRRAERELAKSEKRWRMLSEASFEGVAISSGGVVVDINDTLARWLGAQAEQVIGRSALDFFSPEELPRILREIEQSSSMYETQLTVPGRGAFSVEIRARTARIEGQDVRVAAIRDVTDRKRYEAELKAQADLLRTLSLRDELTGLYNRRGFLELSGQQLRNAARHQRQSALFFADLNGMKRINDNLGHEIGDQAIAATGKLLAKCFRESDIVARLGGDEFAIFAADCDADGVIVITQRVQRAVVAFNASSSAPFELSISVGAAIHQPAASSDLDTLMARADAAMYEQKRARGSSRTSA